MENASICLLKSRDQVSLHSSTDYWLLTVALPNAMLPDSKQQSEQQHQHSSERQLNSKQPQLNVKKSSKDMKRLRGCLVTRSTMVAVRGRVQVRRSSLGGGGRQNQELAAFKSRRQRWSPGSSSIERRRRVCWSMEQRSFCGPV